MFLIFALLIAYYMTRNTVQDMAWKARGQDPPSYRREQDRIARRAKRRPITGRQEARKFWATAWADAWESAHERQQHWHEQGRQRRQEKWIDQAEDEARYINDRIEPGGPAEDVVHEPWGLCQICGREKAVMVRRNESRTAPAEVMVCPSCAAIIDNRRSRERAAHSRPEAAPDAPPTAHPEDDSQPAEPEPAAPSTDATVVDMQNWRTPPTTPEENRMAETTSLAAALEYTAQLNRSAEQGAVGIEQSIAGMEAGDVSGAVITAMRRAQEYATALAGAASDAHNHLAQQIGVKEAYNATGNTAGNKDFVTTE